MQYSTTKICRLGLLVYKQLNHKGSGGGEFTHKMALLVTGAVMPGLLLRGVSRAVLKRCCVCAICQCKVGEKKGPITLREAATCCIIALTWMEAAMLTHFPCVMGCFGWKENGWKVTGWLVPMKAYSYVLSLIGIERRPVQTKSGTLQQVRNLSRQKLHVL